MQVPVQITFHNVDRSVALEERIEQRVAHLEKLFDRITSCHVSIEAPHRHQHQGVIYEVHIDVRLPGAELVVNQSPGGDIAAHENMYTAMNEAFNAMERKISRFKDTLRGNVKTHEEREESGVITKLVMTPGYGFIESDDGLSVYFHKNAVADEKFDALEIGTPVRFIFHAGEGIKGPQASTVKITKFKRG